MSFYTLSFQILTNTIHRIIHVIIRISSLSLMSRYRIPPNLPVPALSESLARFISALRPLLSSTLLSETIRLTKRFEENEGSYLQNKLLEISAETDNWASQTFIQEKFLSKKISLIRSNSAGINQNRFHWANTGAKLATISKYLVFLLNKVEVIRTERLAQDMIRNVPLCMEQYKNVTGVYRQPNPTLDTYTYARDSTHIVVMHAGHIYKMPVYTSEDRTIVSEEKFAAMLSQVLEESSRTGPEQPRSVGLLTAMDRDVWYRARKELMRSPVNAASLKVIEQSLFGLSLDGSNVEDIVEVLKLNRVGDPRENFGYYNRWFDLGLQTIFTNRGYLGWSIEHSISDGSIMPLFENVLSECSHTGEYIVTAQDPNLKVELLKWELSSNIKAELEDMKCELAHFYKQYDVCTLEFSELSKDDIKKQGLNFHTFIHIALQLAYFKLYSKLEGFYHPFTLRFFKGGRLEQPFLITSESKEFVEGMNLRKLRNDEKLTLLKRAMRKHQEILLDVGQGQVYVRHLKALKLLANREGLYTELFESESFKIFSLPHLAALFVLTELPLISTPIPDYYGHWVYFHSIKNSIHFSVSTLLKSSSTTPSSEYALALESSLLELKQILLK